MIRNSDKSTPHWAPYYRMCATYNSLDLNTDKRLSSKIIILHLVRVLCHVLYTNKNTNLLHASIHHLILYDRISHISFPSPSQSSSFSFIFKVFKPINGKPVTLKDRKRIKQFVIDDSRNAFFIRSL